MTSTPQHSALSALFPAGNTARRIPTLDGNRKKHSTPSPATTASKSPADVFSAAPGAALAATRAGLGQDSSAITAELCRPGSICGVRTLGYAEQAAFVTSQGCLVS